MLYSAEEEVTSDWLIVNPHLSSPSLVRLHLHVYVHAIHKREMLQQVGSVWVSL